MLELAGVVLEAVGIGSGLGAEVIRNRRAQKSAQAAQSIISSVDTDAINQRVSTVELAAMMRGRLTATNVQPILQSRKIKNLVKEVVYATYVSGDRGLVDEATSSLAMGLEQELSGMGGGEDVSRFADLLADKIREVSLVSLEKLRDKDPSTLHLVQQSEMLRRVASTLDNIHKHRNVLARESDENYRRKRHRFLGDYRKAVAERHGFISPPDFETNRKIPLSELYVAPYLMARNPRQNIRIRNGVDASNDLERFVSNVSRTVVLGNPGGGKSTLSDWVAANCANDDQAVVPFHVVLRNFANHSSTISVLKYIEEQMGPKYQVEAPQGLVDDLLCSGSAIVIFDGLDELIDTAQRREITRAVEVFGALYPLTPILVTSRRVGYEQAKLDHHVFDEYEIGDFSDANVECYVRSWFNSQSEYTAEQAERLAEGFIAQSRSVPDLRSNPLMLALMCIIFRGENYIPRNRPAVYERCAVLLFEKWDGHRGIEVPLQARDHIDSAMKYLAYKYLEERKSDTGLTEGHLVRTLSEYLLERAFENATAARAAATEFVEYCRGRAWVFSDAGTTESGEFLYTFTHRTFMEYFAALYLVRTQGNPKRIGASLLTRVAHEEWEVVAELAVQQAEANFDQGTEMVLRRMLEDRVKRSHGNRRRILHFITRCLPFAVVSPSFVRSLARMILNHRSSNGEGSGEHLRDAALVMGLIYSSAGQQTGIVKEEIISYLLAELEQPSLGRNVTGMLGVVLQVGMNLNSDIDQARSCVRREVVEAIAPRIKNVDDLNSVEPSLLPRLILSGVAASQTVLENEEFARLHVSVRLFGGPEAVFSESAFWTFLDFLDTPWARVPDDLRPGIVEFAKWLECEFKRAQTEDVSRAQSSADIARDYSYRFDHPADEAIGHPQVVIDAALMGLFAYREIVQEVLGVDSSGQGTAREELWLLSGYGDSQIARLVGAASGELARFAGDWRGGEVSVLGAGATSRPAGSGS